MVFSIPFFVGFSPYYLYLATLVLVYIISVIGLNITLGYAGQITLGHAAFMGIGAYTVAIMTLRGWSFWLAFLLAGIISLVLGAIIGLPAIRVKDHYLAFVTLGFGSIIFLFMTNEEQLTGGFRGLYGIERPQLFSLGLSSDRAFYLFVAFVLILLTGTGLWILNSKWGRAFKAIRENEKRAEMVGVNLLAYKVAAFAIGSLYAGLSGGLLAPLMRFIEPTSFPVTESFWLLIMLVVGGRGRFEGAIIGPLVVMVLPELLRGTEGLYFVLFSLISLIILIFWPTGLAGILETLFEKIFNREMPKLTK